MGTVIRLFEDAAFDPETLNVLCDAFDNARELLHDAGQPEIVNDVIARRIIDLAKQGERDPRRLCEDALSALGSRVKLEHPAR